MALYERWCAQCNDLHDSNSLNNITCKKNILPGTKVWIKKPEPKLFLPVQKIPSNKNRLFGKNKGAIFKKKQKKKVEKVGSIVETAKWQLVPVLSRCQDTITVKMSTGFRVFNLTTSQDCLPANEAICADMTELHYAHKPAILYNLKKRALKKQAYTYIGNVLISINPLRDVDQYLSFDDRAEAWPPHPRTVAERAFQKMGFAAAQRARLLNVDENSRRSTKFAPSKKSLIDPNSNFAQQYGLVNQSIIISGESGSGKTEASRRVLSRLVEREGYGSEFSDEDDPGVFDFQDNLIGTDPILESFGNARTKRNPNSSRFGKFFQLRYDPPSYEDMNNEGEFFIDEASITTYLLERSRITYQEPGEGNFRIFYQLLTSPNEKIHKHLGFTAAGLRFRYLNNEFKRSDHDRIGYRDLRIALKMVKLRVRSLNLFEIVAAVLHIGNIKFVEEQTKEGNVAVIDDPYIDIDPAKKKKTKAASPAAKGSRQIRKRKVNSFSSMVSGVNVADKLRADKANVKQPRSNMVRHRLATAASANRRHSVASNLTNDSVHSGKTEKTVHRVPNENQADEHKYSPIRTACKLLRVNYKHLERMLLEKQIKSGGGERITKRVNLKTAVKHRDAIAKHIYALMFEWIVEKLNDTLKKDELDNKPSNKPFIGILDVFGFEEFKKNSFEQLLINYANEVLLSLFAKEILIGESTIYKEEGLVIHEEEMVNIGEATRAYEDTLKLFEGYTIEKKTFPGIFATINSQQRVPQASDKKLLAQLQKNFKGHPNFPAPHPSKRDKCFIVKHYASYVTYEIQNFLQKNDQTLPPDMEDFFRASHHKILRFFPFLLLSEGKPSAISSKARRRKATRVANDKNPRFSKRRGRRGSRGSKLGSRVKGSKLKRPTKMQRRSVGRQRPQKKNQTVAAQFAKQIEKLRRTLLQTSCSYIRCVKPNPYLIPPAQTLKAAGPEERQDRRQGIQVRKVKAKQSALKEMEARKLTFSASKKKHSVRTYFDEDYISNQLKNLGVYDCVNVLKAGLPTRIPYPTFLLTYSSTISFEELIFYKKRSLPFQQRTFVAALMDAFEVESTAYKLGKTKIFFRSGKLEDVKNVLSRGQLGEENNKSTRRFLRQFERFYCLKLWRACIMKTKTTQFFLDELYTVRAALLLQRVARKFLFHRKFSLKVKEKRAAVCIQCFFRVTRSKKLLSELRAQAVQQKLDVDLDFETKQSKGTSDMDTTNWEDLSLVDNGDAESVEDYTEFSVVGEYNALRPTLKSYFNRRTTYNRKTLAVEKKFGTKYKGKHKRGENSFFSAHRQDSDWSNIEDDLLEFDGEDADVRIHPDQTVIAEDIDEFSSEYDYDDYDDEYDDEDIVDFDLENDMNNTQNDGTIKTFDESDMKGTYRTNESGSRIGSLNDMDMLNTKKSTVVRRRTRYTKSEMRSMLTRSKLTRASKNGKKKRRSTVQVDKTRSNETRDLVPNAKKGKLKIAPKHQEAEPEQDIASAYVKPLRKRAPVNKLNPKKSDYWQKRETKVGKAKPAWQNIKLRTVQRPKIVRDKTTEEDSEPIIRSGSGFAARMAEKFGGSTMKRKPKP